MIAWVFAAAAIAIAVPELPLIYGALLFGVPHLASELYWLVLRRELPKSFLAISAVHAVALIAIAVCSFFATNKTDLARLELAVAASWILIAAPRPLFLAIAIAALFFPLPARDAAIALHAFVSIAIWIFVFRKKKRFAIPAVAAIFAGLAAVLALRGPLIAQAYLQCVHYVVWLVLIPRDAPPAAFDRRGLTVAVIATLAAITVLAAALLTGPEQTRDTYLAVARFHIWMELALAARLLTKPQ